MIKKCLPAIFFLYSISANAVNYYFSTTTGNDEYTQEQAQHSSTPWNSLEKLQSVMASLQPGDSIFFKCGDVFTGSVEITRSGTAQKPIVFASYGNGFKPMISGLIKIVNWTSAGNGIWDAALPSPQVFRMLLLNGNFQHMGRTPNASQPHAGYMQISDAAKGQLTSPFIEQQSDLQDAELIIRKDRWILDRETVISQTTSRLNYAAGNTAAPKKGYGFFIQNHRSTLDEKGEWCVNFKTNRLSIFLQNGNPSSQRVEISAVRTLMNIHGQEYLQINNLTFMGAGETALSISNSQWIKISDCNFLYSADTAVRLANATHHELTGCKFDYSANIAFDGANANFILIKNNIFLRTGIFPGMGGNGSGSYEAVMLGGNNNVIEGNRIDTTGYIPVTFSGNSVTIKNNSINYFGFIKDDCGGIYTWNNSKQATENTARIISGNIVLNGKGAGEGTDAPARLPVNGIYLDDNSSNVKVNGNTVAGCSQYGIFIHNARSVEASHNTVYNNKVQLAMVHDGIAVNSPVKNNTISNNILFAKEESQLAALYKTIDSRIEGFGDFDNNIYGRAINNQLIIEVVCTKDKSGSDLLMDVGEWKKKSGKDEHSIQSIFSFKPYSVGNYTSTNSISNGAFNSNTSGVSAYSPAGNIRISWSGDSKRNDGALAINFTGVTENAKRSSVIIKAGSVTAGKNYLTNYSIAGSNLSEPVEIYLRQSGSPYKDISERKLIPARSLKSEYEVLLVPSVSESNTSLVFGIGEQSATLLMDNLSLRQANITLHEIGNSLRFEYNDTNIARSFLLSAAYMDNFNTSYSRMVILKPYTSILLFRQDFNVVNR
jgi:parallel beta-helix repeat protein